MGSGCSPGGQPTPGKPIGLGGGAPALGGLVGQPKKALCAIGRKSKRKKRRWEKGEGLLLPNLVGLGLEGEGSPVRFGRHPWESLDPKARLPPPPPIYTEVLGLI